MAQQMQAKSGNRTFGRRHKSTGRPVQKVKDLINHESPVAVGHHSARKSRSKVVNKGAAEKCDLSVQFFGKSANLVNLKMHQDENIFSDDVSKTFMDSIDEVPAEDYNSPYFPKRRSNSIAHPQGLASRTAKRSLIHV